MNRVTISQAIEEERFEWRQHSLERLLERKIRQDDVIQVLREVMGEGEILEDYEDTIPYPGGLYFGIVEGRPLHVVAAFDEVHCWAYIITAYEPDLEHFERDYKTRRPE